MGGSKEAEAWRKTKELLRESGTEENWSQAYEQHYHKRLKDRYFTPIETLLENDKLRGEGFSILTIQCSLIEVLATTVKGLRYCPGKRKADLGVHEYSNSSGPYIEFLQTAFPFREEFTPTLATDFYKSVRCGLLHEAKTRNGWIVRAKHPHNCILDPNRKTIFRNGMKRAIERFLNHYQNQLGTSPDAQDAFCRKLDDLFSS